MKKQFLSN
jgi:ABC-type maltose transport system permease subunit